MEVQVRSKTDFV